MNEKKAELGKSIAIDAYGRCIAPNIVIHAEDGTRYRTDAKSYAVVSMGFVSVMREDDYQDFYVDDPRVLAFYAQVLVRFAEWASKGFDSSPEPSFDGEQQVPSDAEVSQLYAKLGIPKEPAAYGEEAFKSLSARLGLPEDEGIDGWYNAVNAAQEAKGPLVELCDGRFVRVADLTEDDRNLTADPCESENNAHVFGGDTFVDGKYVWARDLPKDHPKYHP